MKRKTFDFFLIVNYWIDSHPWVSCAVLFVPYVLGFVIYGAFHFLWPVIVASVFLMTVMFIRLFNPMGSFTYSESIQNNLVDRWLKRGVNQYVYISKVGWKIQIKSLVLKPALYFQNVDHDFPWLAMYDSYWGEWSFSHVRPATKKELEFVKEQVSKAKVRQ